MKMMDNTRFIYVQVAFISWIRTDEVQFTPGASQCGFYFFDENCTTQNSRRQSVYPNFVALIKTDEYINGHNFGMSCLCRPGVSR